MKKPNTGVIILIVLAAIPLTMWLTWLLTPKKKLVIAIVDKTVLNKTGQEHGSLTWVLNQQRYTKTKTAAYNISNDYYGFFPGANEKFKLKGLERFSDTQLDQLSQDADMAYITDAYGIYKNEWYSKGDINDRSGMLYGGLSRQDAELLAKMKARHKLVITEFNTIGSPSGHTNREKFEQLFSLRWTGWVGRYFATLDTAIDKEIPQWLINNYKRSHNGSWPFTKAGIALVSENDEVTVLEEGTHLNYALPVVTTEKKYADKYNLPESINYSFWFDIMNTDTAVNNIVSRFNIKANANGLKELSRFHIPAVFPAVQTHQGSDYKFWYFSADFADNPVTLTSSYFKGIEKFKFLFLNRLDRTDRKGFFWRFYRPLLTTILKDYYSELKSKE
ncbi:hypothetical protein [Foetidibacter luteolus]|uniref:hypothetical protein n=1 Tax=Foetidibacter luteolus TaxID=2608880 RepID=UPI00129B4F94|nr:hypothetical protein [Foetidibacter luteolus]